MKLIREMTPEDLRRLVYSLLIDGAEVQGCEVHEFAERFDVFIPNPNEE